MVDEFKLKRYIISFGHEKGDSCTQLTDRVLGFAPGELVERVDIRALALVDPELDCCRWCDKPLTRVVNFVPTSKSKVDN
jgi:hypothetical protein